MTAPSGNPVPFPTPLGSDVTLAGMLATHQCQKPLPVGASGSKTLTAKLFVPFGAPDQDSAGETFLPVQSQPLNTCSSAIFAPGLMSGLVSVIAFAAPAPRRPAVASSIEAEALGMHFPPPKNCPRRRRPPGLPTNLA